ncbi:MAG: hypothetical protein AXW17_01515 [Colwellia sp. Phe_37]|jgi:hypothetical protein|nr:MAG: hypothetical protein AXW17_01515 [Colwellia sp. Phe_37]|tara:strand:+ start:91475 stop:92113 length:639 start_codon:yes stop_codon:yes gene_type:complete
MSSKRGRPARQMSEDKIINMLEDVYLNKEYFEKLFSVLKSEEEKFFTDFFESFHEKLAETTVKKSRFLISSSEAESRIIELKGSNLNESEIKKRIKDVEAKVAVFEDEDINEFQSVIDKLPDELWIRYNNRLRQQAYKKNNRWSRQIEFSEDAYLDLKVLKNSLNAKTWNDLPLKLKRDYLQIENICAALRVDNLDEALLKIKENKLLMSNK